MAQAGQPAPCAKPLRNHKQANNRRLEQLEKIMVAPPLRIRPVKRRLHFYPFRTLESNTFLTRKEEPFGTYFVWHNSTKKFWDCVSSILAACNCSFQNIYISKKNKIKSCVLPAPLLSRSPLFIKLGRAKETALRLYVYEAYPAKRMAKVVNCTLWKILPSCLWAISALTLRHASNNSRLVTDERKKKTTKLTDLDFVVNRKTTCVELRFKIFYAPKKKDHLSKLTWLSSST